jgi:tripartite-type tricarboxylate transporter receptor subunit TctC
MASCVALLATLVGFSLPASADPVADFYKGKRISLLVSSDPGGGYDVSARLASRHLGRFIPGNPDFLVQNMPGGGGLRATNYLYNVAPKDGTAMGLVQRGVMTTPLLDSRNTEVKYDPLKFYWLGSLTTETGLIVVSTTAPHKEMKDVFEQDLIVGSSGPTTDFMPLFLNKVLGTKFRIISGYKNSTDTYLALERNEVQARISSGWGGDKPVIQPWLDQKKVRILAQLATVKHPDFPDAPLIVDFAHNERERQAMELILSPGQWGRPFLMPPDVPAERAAAVRNAFTQMMKDPEFLADAQKSKIEIDVVTGEEVDSTLHRAYATPADIVDLVRKSMVE